MKFGLIGYPLGHSWSKEIHAHFNHYPYSMYELKPEELDTFLRTKDFDGVNVTIPYKQEVIPYLDVLDPACKKIGAVNCIVKDGENLIGYNTDYIGFRDMLLANHIAVNEKNIAVLGTGGASKAVSLALQELGAHVTLVSRTKRDGVITYDTLYEMEHTFDGIVNTTPVGMYPNCDASPIDVCRFDHLMFVVDIIANPLRTKLLFDAKKQGIRTLAGFEMLVRQAFAADELFLHKKLNQSLIEPCMHQLLGERRNIVLIGMPTAGKSTIAQALGEKLNRHVVEMDDEIVDTLGTSIKTCFEKRGEAYFRNIETEVAKSHRNASGEIISCGVGVIKTEETMRYLSENGIVVYLKRDLSHLYPSDSRPLSSSEEAVKKMYEERLPLYTKYRDIEIENNGAVDKTVRNICKKAIGR